MSTVCRAMNATGLWTPWAPRVAGQEGEGGAPATPATPAGPCAPCRPRRQWRKQGSCSRYRNRTSRHSAAASNSAAKSPIQSACDLFENEVTRNYLESDPSSPQTSGGGVRVEVSHCHSDWRTPRSPPSLTAPAPSPGLVHNPLPCSNVETAPTCARYLTQPDRSRRWSLSLLVVVLVAALARPAPAAAFCPQVCVCDMAALRYSCENAGLDVVPFQLNPEAKSLNLRGNKIAQLEYSLSFYMHLQSLDLSLNSIQSLGSKNLDSLDRLATLNVSGNEISAFHKDAFKGLRALRTLDLSNNLIEKLDRNTFSEMHDLWELHLTGNRLGSVGEGVFSALVNLKVLRLGDNQLLSVPSGAVARLSSLRVLTLTGNLIEQVDDNAFPNLRDLNELSLDDNVIADIQPAAFDGLVSLDRLNLRVNNITTVPAVPLSRLRRLSFLDLSGNMFSQVGAVAFHSLGELRVLRLNRLVRLVRVDARAFADNKRLESVSLEDNPGLTELPTKLFQGNPLLSRVSVRGTAVTTLEAAHFPLERLASLDVADVPLTCNCSLQWLWLMCREQRQFVLLQQQQQQQQQQAAANETATPVPPTTPMTTTVGPLPSAITASELHPIVNLDGIRCAGPPELKGFALVNVPEADVRCEATWKAVVMVTVVVLALFAATCTVLFFLSTGRWCSSDKDASDVSTDSFATQHSSLHSNHLKHLSGLPPPPHPHLGHPAAPLLPGGQVMIMNGEMKVEPTYATIGVGNGRSTYVDDYKKEPDPERERDGDHLVNDFAYQRALKNWDSSFNGAPLPLPSHQHHSHSMGRAKSNSNHHDHIRHNGAHPAHPGHHGGTLSGLSTMGPGNYGTYHNQNHYSMAIDMTKKPPHIVYV